MMFFCVWFAFKQTTAYEMRISDWSSYVCSSELAKPVSGQVSGVSFMRRPRGYTSAGRAFRRRARSERARSGDPGYPRRGNSRASARHCRGGATIRRSEEHTSELQSLMRISYAVFCLKKKKERITQTNTQSTTTRRTK